MEFDRISDLPGNVVDQILSKLLIKDAVKTSVLSTKWRYKYATQPSLVFDDSLLPALSVYEQIDIVSTEESNKIVIERSNKIVSTIDRVLFLHNGPIHKFELKIGELNLPTEEIEKWILFLSRRRLKVFVFTHYGEEFRVPSSLFSCQSMTDLKLGKCSLQPPSTFGGFKNLKSLRLCFVEVNQAVLERLISDSPVLERLAIFYCYTIDQLFVNAQNMQHLTVVGDFTLLRLENTPNLIDFSIYTRPRDPRNGKAKYEDGINLFKLLAGMTQIQRLDIGYNYLSCMTLGEIPRDIVVSLVNLHHLSIKVKLNKFAEASSLLCLLNCAPNLQELHIESAGYREPDTSSWEFEDMNDPFKHLRYLTLQDIDGAKVEMDFIRFMLLTSPALETMAIKLDSNSYGEPENSSMIRAMKELLSFSRASTKARIIIQ